MRACVYEYIYVCVCVCVREKGGGGGDGGREMAEGTAGKRMEGV